ncbi:MAG: hypothetical protein ABEN55_21195 [Bradymonadaceae bacterium]
MTFKRWVKNQAKKRDMTVQEVGDHIGKKYIYQEIDQGPSYNLGRKIADFFDASLDDMPGFMSPESLADAIRNDPRTYKELGEEIGVGDTTISQWANQNTYPTSKHRKRIVRELQKGIVPDFEFEVINPDAIDAVRIRENEITQTVFVYIRGHEHTIRTDHPKALAKYILSQA